MAGEWQSMTAAQAFVINPRIQPPRALSLPFVDMAAVDGNAQYVEASETRGLAGGSRFEDGDTLMARITPCLENGKIARFRSTERQRFGFGSTEFIVFRGRDGVTTSDFAFYTVKSQLFRDFAISQMSGTSGRQRVPTTCFEHLHLSIPPISTQHAITAVLSALDEKIDLNRQMAATLEEMARALFKSWFVDFDPVHAKAEGRDTGLPADIAALFPDSFDDEGLPTGWTRGTPESFVEINPTSRIDRTLESPYIDMAALPTQGPRITSVVSRLVGSGSRFKNGDTLLARITPCLENGKTALVDCLADDEVAWGSTEFIVMRPKESVPPPLAYLIARDAAFRSHVISSMSGTSGRQRAPAEAVSRWSMAIPAEAVISAWGEAVRPMFDGIKANSQETEQLTELRDTLLPKLLSGELRVSDAENVIAAA